MTFASVIKDIVGNQAKYVLMKLFLMLGAFTGIWSQQGLLATRWIPRVMLGSESLFIVGATAITAASGVWKSGNLEIPKSET